MRKGLLTCVLAVAALITFLAIPALADIGVYCGGWDSSTGVSGCRACPSDTSGDVRAQPADARPATR